MSASTRAVFFILVRYLRPSHAFFPEGVNSASSYVFEGPACQKYLRIVKSHPIPVFPWSLRQNAQAQKTTLSMTVRYVLRMM